MEGDDDGGETWLITLITGLIGYLSQKKKKSRKISIQYMYIAQLRHHQENTEFSGEYSFLSDYSPDDALIVRNTYL